MASSLSAIDRARWGSAHWLIFASVSIGYFLWGIIGSLAYILFPEYSYLWYYIVTVAAIPLAGDLILTFISDRILGRKSAYLMTMSLYGAGTLLAIAALLLLPPKTIAQMSVFLLGYAISMLGVEGEVPIGLALLAETTPAKDRPRALVLGPNFENIGAAVAAGVALLTFSLKGSYILNTLTAAILALAGVAVAIALRLKMPESARWLVAKGRTSEAESSLRQLVGSGFSGAEVRDVSPTVGLWARFGLLAAWALANYISWSAMAFLFEDVYFTGAAVYLVMMMANLGASVAGFVAMPLIERMSTKGYTLLSFSTAVASFIPIVAALVMRAVTLPIMSALAFENLFFITFTWFVRTIYEPSLLPTNRRAFLIGVVRSVAISSYSVLAYFSTIMTPLQFVSVSLGLQLAGLIGAGLWHRYGYEVKGATLESVSAPVPLKR